MSLSDAGSPAAQTAISMSFLIDTDVLSLLERRSCPRKLTAWVKTNAAEIFISVVSTARSSVQILVPLT